MKGLPYAITEEGGRKCTLFLHPAIMGTKYTEANLVGTSIRRTEVEVKGDIFMVILDDQ